MPTVTVSHIDTCLSSYLQDHHNRDGECLFGVYVDGTSTRHDVMSGLIDEVRSTGDRIDEAVSDDAIKGAIKSLFADAYGTTEEELAKLFDSSLEVIGEEEGETMGGDEMCQAWFLIQWEQEEEPAD